MSLEGRAYPGLVDSHYHLLHFAASRDDGLLLRDRQVL